MTSYYSVDKNFLHLKLLTSISKMTMKFYSNSLSCMPTMKILKSTLYFQETMELEACELKRDNKFHVPSGMG